MSRATAELDFFGMASSSSSSKSQFQKFIHRQRSFRGIQSAISKINPEVLKNVIASGSATSTTAGGGSVKNQKPENGVPLSSLKSLSVPASPNADHNTILFPSLPVYVPNARPNGESLEETTPLTIFYNGNVSVFDVRRDKAESILKIVSQGSSSFINNNVKGVDQAILVTVDSKQPITPLTNPTQLIHPLNGDLPIARRKSLQRFLEKRKERLTSVSPYGC